ncbi:serpin family protein [Oxynema aestuarii]|uniref:Serpin family protein n=1 Tax=Oxynema aestuarii AP17 TaxID=2064643 RepID=A0A6H1TV35_9CYAN|nr:serpin family protein [Oxynema aestuarii]QIZ69810.1 serpin family protein [Oxynema aestuarii AP17]
MNSYFLRSLQAILFLFLSLSLLGLTACSPTPTDSAPTPSQGSPNPRPTSTPKRVHPEFVNAQLDFSLKLFSQIYAGQKERNIFISPSSIFLALSMTYNGASGDTQTAIADTLGFGEMDLERVNQENLNFQNSLENADDRVTLNIANSLWLNQNLQFLPDFVQRVGESYQAKIERVNFSNTAVTRQINNWVKMQTNGKIDSIVDRLDPDTLILLVNALYFKGEWSEPFPEEETTEAPFTLLNNEKKQIPLMSQSGDYRYLETEQFQAVNLPYGKGRFSMYVFLPKKEVSLTQFYESLTVEDWKEWIPELRSRPGTVKLPRFKLEYDLALNETLKALGMEIAFDRDRADFSNLADLETAYIDRVQHKTFVEVNEEGTEAAATTSVGVTTASAPMNPFEMTVDRPFFCVIRDNQTGMILFMGSIVDPS